ncbi:metallophosphoesterase [bacterium]|nr:metallophosphoesterase [bacterium]
MSAETGIRIAHLTDSHIAPDDSLVRDIDTRQNFEAVLESIADEHPDIIVLGGDLAAVDGDLEAYRWIESRLADIEIPYLIIAGNHDNTDNLKSVFKISSEDNEELFFAIKIGNYQLIGLDSSKGRISNIQLDWLRETMSSGSVPSLLFMHHPPLYCGCEFMDSKYPLENREEVFAVIQNIPTISHIFCGHYHTEKIIFLNNKSVFITPSTMHQIGQAGLKYKEVSRLSGWRKIEWNKTGLKSSVTILNP